MTYGAWAESVVLYDRGERKKGRKRLQRETLLARSCKYDHRHYHHHPHYHFQGLNPRGPFRSQYSTKSL